MKQAKQDEETKSSEQNNGEKKVHWSDVQSQGFQTCAHTHHHQDNINDTREMECASNNTEEVDATQPEEAHELKQISKHNTDGIALLDT